MHINEETTWSYKGYIAETEVSHRTDSLLYYIVTPKGERYYHGAYKKSDIDPNVDTAKFEVIGEIEYHIANGEFKPYELSASKLKDMEFLEQEMKNFANPS